MSKMLGNISSTDFAHVSEIVPCIIMFLLKMAI